MSNHDPAVRLNNDVNEEACGKINQYYQQQVTGRGYHLPVPVALQRQFRSQQSYCLDPGTMYPGAAAAFGSLLPTVTDPFMMSYRQQFPAWEEETKPSVQLLRSAASAGQDQNHHVVDVEPFVQPPAAAAATTGWSQTYAVPFVCDEDGAMYRDNENRMVKVKIEDDDNLHSG
jgi:hypothetical protein